MIWQENNQVRYGIKGIHIKRYISKVITTTRCIREWLGTITVGSNQYRIYMPSLRYENSVSDGIKIGTITLGEQSFDVYAPASSAGGSTVSVVPKTLTGTNIAEITVDGTTYQLYAPTSGGGSGSTVTAEATLTEGTQIGKITIDGIASL